ncbi:MAG: SpoIID/LytB domain-containing protein [Bacillota bacterium]
MRWQRETGRIITLALIISVLFGFSGQVDAGQQTLIRVGLSLGKTLVSFQVSSGSYQLIDVSTGLPVGQPAIGEIWTVSQAGPNLKLVKNGVTMDMPFKGPLYLEPVQPASGAGNETLPVFIHSNTRYRGSLTIANESAGLLAVNILGIEEYLYGVVGKEMGYTAPEEALKAQAVVSRSYALSNRSPDAKYDVGIDTNTQVYGGYDAEFLPGADNVIKAVYDTTGKVILDQGKVAAAYFHANAGGYTENSENVWLNAVPYIKAVPSSEDAYALRYPYQTNGWPGNSYQWTVTLTREQFVQKIKDWNASAQANNKPDNMIQVGDILDLVTTRWQRGSSTETTASARVTQLDYVGSEGVKSFYRDAIRSVLGLKSTLFDAELDSRISTLSGQGAKKSMNRGDQLSAIGAGGVVGKINGTQSKYVVLGNDSQRSMPKVFQQVIIRGKGHGHGLGMSQWGARGMALEKGYNYVQIIQNYFSGVTIGDYQG